MRKKSLWMKRVGRLFKGCLKICLRPLFHDEDVDETDWCRDPKDIELVVTQAGVPRSRAGKALKPANGDIVPAI
ncbi:nascent polypeptide-associated complex subunit alpha-like protein, partial [Trifolium pratense]